MRSCSESTNSDLVFGKEKTTKWYTHKEKESEPSKVEIELLHMAVTAMIHDAVETEFRDWRSLRVWEDQRRRSGTGKELKKQVASNTEMQPHLENIQTSIKSDVNNNEYQTQESRQARK
ncbi:hypothetical protein P8452_50815 [Trifolium repens]|nr:hypothetical protein P8452_50815 [Trifolium repens]